MGSINRFDLTRIARDFKTPFFFETGTFYGDGVEYALRSSFQKVVSVEIIPSIADEARKRFASRNTAKIVENDSVSALESELPGLNGNCIFWLDAHFPGADAGMNDYDKDGDESLRLPLIKEIETIRRLRSKFNDVIIIDDLRIYEDGPFENGNVPPDALPKENRHIRFVYDRFGMTHLVLKCYLDEGYILLFPKIRYWKKHLTNNLFSKRLFKKDFYLLENKSQEGTFGK